MGSFSYFQVIFLLFISSALSQVEGMFFLNPTLDFRKMFFFQLNAVSVTN